MAYRRFYLDPKQRNGDVVIIDGDLFHHIVDVCRFSTADRFEVLFGGGDAFLVEIMNVGKRQLEARVLSHRQLPSLPGPRVTLALSLPKLPKVDWIIEKCVELGVREVRPFVSDYSFLRKVDEISLNRRGRWDKLVTAATQQSGRGDLMQIHEPVVLSELLAQFNRQPQAAGLFPYEGQAPLSLLPAIAEIKARQPEHIWLFVGSEGGFSSNEVALFASHGLPAVSMGEQILRVETACVALVSIIKYEFGSLR